MNEKLRYLSERNKRHKAQANTSFLKFLIGALLCAVVLLCIVL